MLLKNFFAASYIILKGKHSRTYIQAVYLVNRHIAWEKEPDADTGEPLREIESLYETTSLSVLRHFVITMHFVIPYAFCNKRCSIL